MQGRFFDCHRTTCGRWGGARATQIAWLSLLSLFAKKCCFQKFLKILRLHSDKIFNLSPNLHFFLALMVKLEFFVTKKRSPNPTRASP